MARQMDDWAPMAHACNPSYSGGRDQEDLGSKPNLGKQFSRPYLEKPFTKIGLVEWLKVKVMSSSPSTTKKKGQVYEENEWLKKHVILNVGDQIAKIPRNHSIHSHG
jgi:hypothetical protein